MTSGKFKYLLTLFGYEADKWIRPISLREIIVNDSGNHVYGYTTEKVMFSVTDEVVYIKKSHLSRESDVLNKSMFIDETTLLINSGTVNPYKGEKKLRYPKTNDLIGLIDANNNPIDLIDSKGNNIGTTTLIKSFKKMPDNSGTVIELYDNTLYLTSKNSDCKLLAYIVLADKDELTIVNPRYPHILFSDRDITKREADAIIPFSKIVGLEFTLTPENSVGD